MKTIIFLLLLPLLNCFNFVYGQDWHFVSQTSTNLVITDELHGFYYENYSIGIHINGYRIYRSDNGNYNFNQILGGSGDSGCCGCDGLFCLDSETIFYIKTNAGNATVHRSINGVSTIVIPGFPQGSQTMYFTSPTVGYVTVDFTSAVFPDLLTFGVGGSNIYHDGYFFGGTQMEFINDSTGFITGQDGEFSLPHNQVILKTADYGNTLSEVFSTNEFEFKDIHFVADSVGIAIGTNGMILKTQDTGVTWDVVNSNTSLSLNSIDFSDEGVGCIVGEEGLILKSYDLGETWVQVPFIGTQNLIYVRIFNNEHIFINDETGSLYSSQDNSGVDELSNTNKTLVKILDMMGRETTFKPNIPLIYVYDDGSTERVFSVEY